MWVDSITFFQKGKGLRIYVKVVDEIGPVAGAATALSVTREGFCPSWNFNGTTDAAGTTSFSILKAPAGSYTVRIWDVTATGHEWDTSQGFYSASYTSGTSDGNSPKGH